MFYIVDSDKINECALIMDTDALDLEWVPFKTLSYYIKNGIFIENVSKYNLNFYRDMEEYQELFICRVSQSAEIRGYLGRDYNNYFILSFDYFTLREVRQIQRMFFSNKYRCWVKIINLNRLMIQYEDYCYDMKVEKNGLTVNGKFYAMKTKMSAYEWDFGKFGVVDDRYFNLSLGHADVNLRINKSGGITSRTYGLIAKNIVGKPIEYEKSRKVALLRG